MLLYHAGFEVIKQPDIHHGRKNADFGQGFYMTAQEEFARRWAKEKDGAQVIINTYELDTTDLKIHEFKRDEEWFKYIYANRHLEPDNLGADVVMGPIANDTIYDTLGIITSGYLKPEEAMRLLLIGPEYRQITIKTEKAVDHLKWLSAETVRAETLPAYREIVAAEQNEYLNLISEEMSRL